MGDFEIKNGELLKYNGAGGNVVIPKGVTRIGRSAFQRCSSLTSIIIPEGVTSIESGAFEFCDRLTSITIPKGVTYIGECAFRSCNSLTSLIIPEGVTSVGKWVFDCSGPIHLEMSVNCPFWLRTGEAKMYGFASSLLNYSGSSITFMDSNGKKVAYIVLSNEDETEPKKNGAILSIKSENGKFDFAGYDAYFANLAKIPNKIRVALARLEYPYELSAEMEIVYNNFIKRHGVEAGMLLIDENRLELLEKLGENKILTEKTISKLIEYAETKENVQVTSWLLEYNNKAFGNKKTKNKISLGELPDVFDAEMDDSMKISEWRKQYKFKFKDGGIVITKYCGNDEYVTIPEKIGDKYVIGIGHGAFYRMGFIGSENKNIKKIIVPGTISFIESGAICIVENLEIEIQEGVKELPKYAIDIVKNVTVKLPVSLERIEKQFGDSVTGSIKMIVPEKSCAEKFCKKYKLSYTTYIPEETEAGGRIADIKEQQKKDKEKNEKKKSSIPWKKPKAGAHLISRYQGTETNVVFPTDVDGVSITGVANTAGETPDNYKNIKTIVIPEGYTYIGKNAFAGCENLEKITLPSTIKEINTNAFAGCKMIKELYIGEDAQLVGNNIFSQANIETLVIQLKKNTVFRNHTFFDCHINNLIIIGGVLACDGILFCYEKMVDKNTRKVVDDLGFPKAVYTNNKFDSLDLNRVNGVNKKKIHSLDELDISIIESDDIKNAIMKHK